MSFLDMMAYSGAKKGEHAPTEETGVDDVDEMESSGAEEVEAAGSMKSDDGKLQEEKEQGNPDDKYNDSLSTYSAATDVNETKAEPQEEEPEDDENSSQDDYGEELNVYYGIMHGAGITGSLPEDNLFVQSSPTTSTNPSDDPGSDDLSLPKATVTKILSEILASEATSTLGPDGHELATSKDFRDFMAECCVEFITMLSSEANEISENEAKKTMSAEHIAESLKQLGFENYIDAVMESAEEFKRAQASREKKQSKIEQSGLSNEELMAQQEALFASAAAKHRQREHNDPEG